MAETPQQSTETVIRPRVRTPRRMRWLNIVIAVLAVVLLASLSRRFFSWTGYDLTKAWLLGMIAAMGLTAIVEAIWPSRIHLFISSWSLNTMAASFLVSWAAGGERWLGWAGLAMLVVSFLAAAVMTAKAKEVRLGDDEPSRQA